MNIPIKYKDPDSIIDFVFDWTEFFDDSDTITDATIIGSEGLTVDSQSVSNNTVVIWLSGGTVGSRYLITCRITTAAGRVADASCYITIAQR